MQFKNYRKNLSHRFLKKKTITLILLLLFLPVFAFASNNNGGDVQKIDVQDAKTMVRRAEKLTRRGEFVEAEKILRSALNLYPQNENVRLKLAYVLLKQKQLRPAFDLAYEVAQANPKNSYAFAIIGTAYLSSGNFTEARTFLYNALRLNKREALAWAGAGMLDFYENRILKGLDNLAEAVYFDASEPDFIFTYAQVAARAERYKDAAVAYEKFLQISPRNDQERRERIEGLIRFLTFLGNRQSLYDVDSDKKTVVPVSLINDRPVITLRINGKEEPLRFVLDTGSGISVISRQTAEKLKLKPVARGGLARAIGGDGKFQIVYGFVNKVEIGDVKVSNVPVYIREFHDNSEKIDGYIGLALISKFLATIDYGNQTFSLTGKDLIEPRKAEAENLILPLRLTSSGFLSGEVMLEGIESSLNFIVDTGASISVISDEVAGKETIRQFVRKEKLKVIGAAGITEDVAAYVLPRVSFGKHSREKIKAVALDLDVINEASGFHQAGILGGNFLKNYSVTFDFQNSKVLFVPVGSR